MTKWYAPLTPAEWFKRAVSFLNLSIVLVVCLFVFTEFRYDWTERLTGAFLAATNSGRPETGTVWKTGEQASKAQSYLNEIVAKHRDIKREVRESASFAELASAVLPGEWINIEKDHFKKLYLKLPDSVAAELMLPVRLVWLFNTSKLDRIFLEGGEQGFKIYFLDAENRVIEKISVGREVIEKLKRGTQTIEASLDEFAGFKGRIYTADRFFKAVMELPGDMIPDLVGEPAMLLREKGTITRVGIWNETRAGYIRLGFEFVQTGEKRILFMRGREWAVWQLSGLLKKGGR